MTLDPASDLVHISEIHCAELFPGRCGEYPGGRLIRGATMNLRRSLSIYWSALREWWDERPRFTRPGDPAPDPRMQAIIETTLRMYSGKMADNVTRNNPLLTRLSRR